MSGLAVATISTIIYTIAYIAREKYHKKEKIVPAQVLQTSLICFISVWLGVFLLDQMKDSELTEILPDSMKEIAKSATGGTKTPVVFTGNPGF